ncbi:MAG: hypothetical protein ACI4EI_06655 [Muricoprocola sp.]
MGMLPSSGLSSKSGGGSSAGNTISVNVGGVTISVNADGESGDIVSSIKAKKKEISRVIQEMMAEALEEAFENRTLAAQQ